MFPTWNIATDSRAVKENADFRLGGLAAGDFFSLGWRWGDTAVCDSLRGLAFYLSALTSEHGD